MRLYSRKKSWLVKKHTIMIFATILASPILLIYIRKRLCKTITIRPHKCSQLNKRKFALHIRIQRNVKGPGWAGDGLKM